MDGLFHGKPYEQMDDLGVFPYFWKHPYRENGRKHAGGFGTPELAKKTAGEKLGSERQRVTVFFSNRNHEWWGLTENHVCCQMCQGLNSHYFHIIGDKLINTSP